MDEPIWEQLQGRNPELEVQLGELLLSDSTRAIFQAEYPKGTQNTGEVDVRFFLEGGTDPRERVNRFLEAKYFDHPHILRYLDAGMLLRGEDTFTYAVTERADELVSRSLAPEAALTFARHVLSALEYLHRTDLVYCVLSPEAAVRIGTDWKLSDFSQLRLSGMDTSDEVSALAATLDTSPPEAAEGLISPAWDIWSFGQTLRRVLPGYKANITDGFRAVFLACLNLNPSSRPSVQQLSALLDTARASTQQASLSSVAKA